MTLVVDLDTQKGQPTEYEALRIGGNLVTTSGDFAPPEIIRKVGIGTRVKMLFNNITDDFALPQWTVDTEAEQPEKPWRYPEDEQE